MTFLITLLAFAATLELLVVIHEGGHFLAARFCGVRVIRFSVGFGPILWKIRGKSGTEFALSLLPLGGYVKMLDSRDPTTPALTAKDKAEDFEGKKLWQRALIVFAGPFMNLLFAVLILWGIGFVGTYELSSRVAAPPQGTPAAAAGVQGGQYVIGVGDGDVKTFADLQMKLLRVAGTESTITVRDAADKTGEHAERYSIDLRSVNFKGDPNKTNPLENVGLIPWQRDGAVPVEEVMKGSAAESAGLRKGDQIASVNGNPVTGAVMLVKTLRASGGDEMTLGVKRGTDTVSVKIRVPEVKDPKTGKNVGQIGIRVGGFPDVVRVRLGPWDSLTAGVGKLWDMSVLTLRVMGKMVVGEASVKNLSGPVAIADYAGQAVQVGLLPFLLFLSMMSISLGILNLLPIPVLDGGYLAMYLYELIVGRKPSEQAIGIAQRAGLLLILFVTLIALMNDVTRLFGG